MLGRTGTGMMICAKTATNFYRNTQLTVAEYLNGFLENRHDISADVAWNENEALRGGTFLFGTYKRTRKEKVLYIKRLAAPKGCSFTKIKYFVLQTLVFSASISGI